MREHPINDRNALSLTSMLSVVIREWTLG